VLLLISDIAASKVTPVLYWLCPIKVLFRFETAL